VQRETEKAQKAERSSEEEEREVISRDVCEEEKLK